MNIALRTWLQRLLMLLVPALSLVLIALTEPLWARAQQAVVLGPGNAAVLAGTRLHCSVSTKHELLCSTRPADPLKAGYTFILNQFGRVVAARVELTGVKIVYSRGGTSSPGAFSSTPRAGRAVHAGDTVSVKGTTIGCTVGQVVMRCASRTRNGRPRPGSVGFVIRTDGTGAVERFVRPAAVLYDGKLAAAGSHTTFSLTLNDVFAVVGTTEVCGVAGDTQDLVVDCLIGNGQGGARDGTYGTLFDAKGRAVVVRYEGGKATIEFARKPAMVGRAERDISIDVGDRVTITGTSIDCRVDRIADRKYVLCATTKGTQFGPPGSYATLLEQDGIAGVMQFDAKGASHVVFLKHP